MKRITRSAALALLAVAVGGCAVGPDFRRPGAPAVNTYTAAPLPAQPRSIPLIAGAAQHFAEGRDVPAEWWTLFGSNALNELVAAALRANPDLQTAEAALRAAQENAAAQRGAYFPSVDAHITPTRQKIADPLASPAASGNYLYTLHTAQLNISYVPDVFGGTRRQVEASTAQAEVARFQRHAAYLTLTSNLVAAAIQEASLRAQLKATRDLVAAATRQLDMVKKQKQAGQLGAADVAAQEAALAQVEASLPPLEKQIALQRNLLTVLAGRFPSEEIAQQFELASLKLPEELPLSLPARLVEQRPDIRAAEAQLHAASAQVGVATAARLPNITLTASLGSSAVDAATLFKFGTGFWSIVADLAQPIFKGGTLMHQQRAAEAAYDQAAAQYRSTVLTAFQNVADTLHAIDADAKTLRATLAAERAAHKSLTIAQRQWELGLIAYPAVLQAQQAYQQAVIGLTQAQAARYADTVALFQALGGGWWNRADRGDISSRSQ
jgi:NodT family efflux transporter outer membrane factor (OMF) lipoprotein